jgi:hypothetical protein
MSEPGDPTGRCLAGQLVGLKAVITAVVPTPEVRMTKAGAP